jgi:hypothetical protein
MGAAACVATLSAYIITAIQGPVVWQSSGPWTIGMGCGFIAVVKESVGGPGWHLLPPMRGFSWWEFHLQLGAGSQVGVVAPVWVPLSLMTLGTALLFWRGRARPKPGHCGECGYDRAGLAPDAVCPECGAAAPAPRSVPS